MKKNSNFYVEIINGFSSQLKNPIFKYENSSNNKTIYFYEDCFIFIYSNQIIRYAYNKISYINENKISFILSFETDSMEIKKSALNYKSIVFLKKLIKDYKNMNDFNGKGNASWESIDFNNSNPIFSSISTINFNSIREYYKIKKVRFDIFFYYFFNHLIQGILLTLILWSILHIFAHSNLKLIYLVILVPGILFSSELFRLNKYIEVNTNEKIKYENKIKIFFYKDFLIIKSPNIISCHEYKKLKIIYENEDFIFIKFKFTSTFIKNKSVIYPLIINKYIITKKETNFIYNYLKK